MGGQSYSHAPKFMEVIFLAISLDDTSIYLVGKIHMFIGEIS